MSRKDDKMIDPNTVQIPKEMHERKRLLDPKDLPFPPMMEGVEGAHRFDILPSNPIHDDEFCIEEEEDDADESSEAPGKKRRKRRKESSHVDDPSRQRYRSGNGQQAYSSKVTVTGDNYMHIYQEQQKQTLEEQLKMSGAKTPEQIRQENADKQKALEQTARARQIQDQIVWWKQQYGQGQYEDGVINATIEQLQYELGAIPTGLW